MIRVAIAGPRTLSAIERRFFRALVRAVLAGEGVADADISLAFVDNPTIHALNRRYLQHDEPTDVLSFPLSAAGERPLAGELVIGVDVAREQARARGHALRAELALYVIHGLLHLCGYDDRTAGRRKIMRQRERHWLCRLRLPIINENDESR